PVAEVDPDTPGGGSPNHVGPAVTIHVGHHRHPPESLESSHHAPEAPAGVQEHHPLPGIEGRPPLERHHIQPPAPLHAHPPPPRPAGPPPLAPATPAPPPNP